MKVLFVGEGPHDVGPPDFAPGVRAATGVMPTLARRVCPAIGGDSVSIFWREIPVLPARPKLKGWAAKVRSSIALAVRNQCDGTVCVADQDRDADRLPAMNDGASAAASDHRIACGVAIESIEAWILGAPTAIASVLEVTLAEVQKHYRLKDVEDFYQNSDKAEKRPKDLLDRIAEIEHRTAGTSFREEVAQRADVSDLERNCPQGFKPFADKLRAVFGPRP
jgi:hypothetical protein